MTMYSNFSSGSGMGKTPTLSLTAPDQKKKKWLSKFETHFNNWICQPINDLVASHNALIGFIFMTCVVDYLGSFWWGEPTSGSVRCAFTGFIQNYFPIKQYYVADDLYENLRCGLVHNFTIKKSMYILTQGDFISHGQHSGKCIILNAENFRDDLFEAKDKYFADLENQTILLDKAIKRYNRDGFMEPKRYPRPKIS